MTSSTGEFCLTNSKMVSMENEDMGLGTLGHTLYQFGHQLLLLWWTVLEYFKGTLDRSKIFFGKNSMTGEKEVKPLKDIPGPFPFPFFGTTLSRSVGNSNLNASNEGIVKKYGTIVKLEHYCNYPLIVLYDADDIEKVLKVASIYRPEMEIVARHRKTRSDRYDSVGIVNSQGEEWKKFRTSLNLINNNAYILNYVSSCDEIMTDFIQVMRNLGKSRIENFDDLVLRLTFENSSKFILNKRMNFLDSRRSQKMDVFIHASHQYFKALQVSMYGFPSWKYFPCKVWNQFVKYEDEMYDIFSELVEDEIRNNTAGGLLKSILEAEQLSLNDRRTLARDLILAAMEPIQNSTIIALYWISRHPEVDAKLYEELKRILPTKNAKFEENTLQHAPYLKACIQETFRINPTTPNLARFIETDIQVQNFHIPPYTLIVCQHWFACLQEKNFYRAKDFIPERWLVNHDDGDSVKGFTPHRPRLLYHFGYGRRECPGRRFAFQEISITVAKLLRNFKIFFPEELNVNYFFLQQPSFPVPIDIIERSE